MDKLKKLYLVKGSNGQVVTVGYRTESIKRKKTLEVSMLKFISSIEEVAVLEGEEGNIENQGKYIESVFLAFQVGVLSIPLEIFYAIILPLIEGVYHVVSIISSALFYGFSGKLRLTKEN